MRTSLFKLSGLPDPFGALLLSFSLILLLAPYFSGADFGLFKIPVFTLGAKKWLKLIGPIVFTVCLLAFLPILPVRKGVDTSADRLLLHAQFSGFVEAKKGDEAISPTRANLTLDLSGTVLSGTYHNDTGDQGMITGKIDGNSLDLRFLSSKFKGECALRGTLSSDNSKIEGIYTCPDGEQGKVTLLRQ